MPASKMQSSKIFGDMKKDHDESEEWLKLRIEKLKELRIEMRVRAEEMRKQGTGNEAPTAESCANQFLIMYSRLIEAFEVFSQINDKFYGHSIVLDSLSEDWKAHKDVLEYFKTSMEQTQKTLKEGK